VGARVKAEKDLIPRCGLLAALFNSVRSHASGGAQGHHERGFVSTAVEKSASRSEVFPTLLLPAMRLTRAMSSTLNLRKQRKFWISIDLHISVSAA
jgi:hypothetical protein